MRHIVVFISLFIVHCSLLSAQETFTERLQTPVAGQGTVRLHHDAEIAALVNGKRPTAQPAATSLQQRPDTTSALSDTLSTWLTPGRKVRMNGYRVQVYAGGNSRDAKRRAYQMEGQVRSLFPEQNVYTRFVSPRWICHVGDFRTREEALELLTAMRRTGRFPEAITVRCKITTTLYE